MDERSLPELQCHRKQYVYIPPSRGCGATPQTPGASIWACLLDISGKGGKDQTEGRKGRHRGAVAMVAVGVAATGAVGATLRMSAPRTWAQTPPAQKGVEGPCTPHPLPTPSHPNPSAASNWVGGHKMGGCEVTWTTDTTSRAMCIGTFLGGGTTGDNPQLIVDYHELPGAVGWSAVRAEAPGW